MASPSSSSSSSSSEVLVTQYEFNAFHKLDRVLFTRLVIHLRRDISQSLQVMSFLLYLEKSGLFNNLIVNLVSLPEVFTNAVAEEVMMCLSCLSYEDFSTFVANSKTNINSFTIPLITRMTKGYLTLVVIHQNRENILLEMKKHLNSICYPAFEDICVQAEMNNKEIEEREKAKKKMRINRVVHKPQSRNKFLSDQQETTRKVGTLYDKTVFLTFSKGYPLSEVEVYAYFTRRFGDVIEAIIIPEGERCFEQALFAKMVLHSAAMIPDILRDGITCRNKYTINGKDVWVRQYFPRSAQEDDTE